MTELSNIKVMDFRTGEVIGSLSKEEVDEQFLIELQHDNIEAVKKDGSSLMYKTKESRGSYCHMKKGEKAKLGNVGTFSLTPAEVDEYGKGLEMIAAQYAVGMGAEYEEKDCLYIEPFSRSRWKSVDYSEKADRTVTIVVGGLHNTFQFVRVWKELEGQK